MRSGGVSGDTIEMTAEYAAIDLHVNLKQRQSSVPSSQSALTQEQSASCAQAPSRPEGHAERVGEAKRRRCRAQLDAQARGGRVVNPTALVAANDVRKSNRKAISEFGDDACTF